MKKGRLEQELIKGKSYLVIFFLMIAATVPYRHANAMNGYVNMSMQLKQLIIDDPILKGAIAG
ncbi:MAG: hypothetical protein K6T88_19445, partial [Bacillus sp. (in: Bacteria)]|nr:hypothetical protein [Bacillus sp. (in: firmicutes)]